MAPRYAHTTMLTHSRSPHPHPSLKNYTTHAPLFDGPLPPSPHTPPSATCAGHEPPSFISLMDPPLLDPEQQRINARRASITGEGGRGEGGRGPASRVRGAGDEGGSVMVEGSRGCGGEGGSIMVEGGRGWGGQHHG